MNSRILLLIAGILAGGAAVYFLPRPGENVANTDAPAPEVAAKSAAPAASTATANKPAAAKVESSKPAVSSAWAKLAEKFGAEKAQLSKKITSDLADVIDEGMALANAGAKNAGAASVAEAASKEAMRNLASQLGLSEDQQQKASELIQSAVGERMTAITDLASAMRTEPEGMMEMFLAGDALAKKEITQEEYDQMTLPTRTMLQNIGGFVMGRPGGGASQLLGDEAFTKQINSLLTPEQQTKLAELTTQWNEQAQNRSGRRAGSIPFQNGQIPVLELEKLDKSVASVKSLVGAGKIMMEAMKGLRDANPNLQQPPTP